MLEKRRLSENRLELRQERFGEDERVRAAVVEHVGIIGGRQQRVDGYRHDSGLDRAQEGGRKIDSVLQTEQDALLHVHAEAMQARRQSD